jgi:dCMP deaminase
MPRPDWPEYFMTLAHAVATRATCDRKHVGAVVVKNNRVIASGYNGAVSGMRHCDDVGHELEENHCSRAVHAEINAICQAARYGVALDGAECYITASPCWGCFKALVNAGIKKIVYGEFYRDKRIFDAAAEIGIELKHLQTETNNDAS